MLRVHGFEGHCVPVPRTRLSGGPGLGRAGFGVWSCWMILVFIKSLYCSKYLISSSEVKACFLVMCRRGGVGFGYDLASRRGLRAAYHSR